MYVVPTCVSVYPMYSWCLQRSEEDTGSSGTGSKDGCKSPRGCWEPGPLREHPLLLTTTAICAVPTLIF